MIIKRAKHYYKKGAQNTLRVMRSAGEKVERRKYLFAKLPGGKKLPSLVHRYTFAFGVLLAIIASLVLTVFSVLLYVVTGTAKLDLSRPGYEGVRQKVAKSSPSQHGFDPSGPLDSKIISEYLEDYKKQSQSISKYDNFNPRLLDDAPLGLHPTQTEPSDGATQ